MKFLLFAVLMTVVYSWEEITDSIRAGFNKLIGKGKGRKTGGYESDHFVSTTILLAWIPVSMVLFLASDGRMSSKLGWLIAQLLLINLFMRGFLIFKNRMNKMDRYSGWEKTGLVFYSLAGLILPTYRMFYYDSYYNERLVAKFAGILMIPALAGLLISMFFPSLPNIQTDILPNINQLIVVMVGGLFILITIEFLEKFLIVHPFRLFSFVRIVLGLFAVVILANGII